MNCHQCGVCCVEISISSPLPGMPNGKKAGERCVNLSDKNLCKCFGMLSRPKVCGSFQASIETCGSNGQEATKLIRWLEKETTP